MTSEKKKKTQMCGSHNGVHSSASLLGGGGGTIALALKRLKPFLGNVPFNAFSREQKKDIAVN